MKLIILLMILLPILSCKSAKDRAVVEMNQIKDKVPELNVESYDSTDNQYNIANLRLYTDTSKFIARLRYHPSMMANSIIELDEIANGIQLCVKQPIVQLHPGEEYSNDRSLAFNKLCYLFADTDAQEIKSYFKYYMNGRVIIDNSCCEKFDPSKFGVEIYNHGGYSSLTKCCMVKEDSAFVNFIFSKVKLSMENDYYIKY